MAGTPAIRSCASEDSYRHQQLYQLVGLHCWRARGRTGQPARSGPEISESATAPRPDAGLPLHAHGTRRSCAEAPMTKLRSVISNRCGRHNTRVALRNMNQRMTRLNEHGVAI